MFHFYLALVLTFPNPLTVESEGQWRMQKDFLKLHEIFPTCRTTLDWKTASSKESYRHWGVGKNKPRTGMGCWDVGMLQSQGIWSLQTEAPYFGTAKVLGSWLDDTSHQRNDFELHWLLHRKQKLQEISWSSSHWGGLRLMWSFLHVCFLCRYYIFIFYDSLSSWHNFGHLPAILAKQFRTPLENGTWTSSFLWDLIHTREIQRGRNLSLLQKGSWAWQTLETNPVAKAETLKIASIQDPVTRFKFLNKRVVDLGNLRKTTSILLFFIFHFFILEYVEIWNYHNYQEHQYNSRWFHCVSSSLYLTCYCFTPRLSPRCCDATVLYKSLETEEVHDDFQVSTSPQMECSLMSCWFT